MAKYEWSRLKAATGLNNKEIARCTGIHIKAISKFDNGTRTITKQQMNSLILLICIVKNEKYDKLINLLDKIEL